MSSTRPILIIVGKPAVRETVADHLAVTGKFRLVQATTLDGATECLNAGCFDAVFLGIQLPDGDGIEFCSRLRSLGHKMPIILLSDGSTDADVVRGLDAGANDCITNISRSEEMLARLRAQLRVFDSSMDATLTIGSFTFRPPEKVLVSPQTNHRIRLTTREAELLKFLHRAGGSYITRQRLLSEVWGYKTGVISSTLDTHITRLRKKMAIEARCDIFIAMPGGYRLDAPLERPDASAFPY